MAPKRSVPLENPPSASSGEETEQSSSSGEEEEIKQKKIVQKSESEEEEEESPPKKNPSVQNPKPITTQKPQSGSKSGTEEGSDSETESAGPTASGFAVEPIASKPMDESSSKPASKSGSKPSALEPKPSAKRTAETETDSVTKRSKVSDDVQEEKKSARVWSEDDEIVVLKGMADYESKLGAPPGVDYGAFHAFIKDLLHADVTKSQLINKLRRLKEKYQNNKVKVDKGEDLSKPHEYKSFELSKKIWGCGSSRGADDSVNKNDKKSNGRVKDKSLAKPKEEAKTIVLREEEDEKMAEKADFWSMYPHWNAVLESEKSPYLSLPQGGRLLDFVKKGLSSIGEANAKKMEKKWRDLWVEELQLHSKRLELAKKQTDLVLEGMKS